MPRWTRLSLVILQSIILENVRSWHFETGAHTTKLLKLKIQVYTWRVCDCCWGFSNRSTRRCLRRIDDFSATQISAWDGRSSLEPMFAWYAFLFAWRNRIRLKPFRHTRIARLLLGRSLWNGAFSCVLKALFVSPALRTTLENLKLTTRLQGLLCSPSCQPTSCKLNQFLFRRKGCVHSYSMTQWLSLSVIPWSTA